MAQKFSDVDGYIASLPLEVQDVAGRVRSAIKSAAPNSVEVVSYAIPAFNIAGSTFIYFAVWKTHVGFYPIYRGTEAFEREIAPFRAKKDSVHFPLKAPMPYDLIGRIVRSQIEKLTGA